MSNLYDKFCIVLRYQVKAEVLQSIYRLRQGPELFDFGICSDTMVHDARMHNQILDAVFSPVTEPVQQVIRLAFTRITPTWPARPSPNWNIAFDN